MPWRARLARTRTGQVGATLDCTQVTALTDETNGTPSASIALTRDEVDRIGDSAWWETGRNSIIFDHRHQDVDEWRPIIAGPIVHYPKITAAGITLDMAGIQDVLSARGVINEWRDSATREAWKEGGPYWEGSLGQIAWHVVEQAMAKPRGGLPIVHGTPEEYITDDTRKGRGYPNWDISNANAWTHVLKKLAEEDGGPDLRFTPRYVEGSNGRRIEWVFEHGTHHDPRIAHPYTLRLNTAAADSAVSDLEATVSGLDVAHRVYGSGAGQGAGTYVDVAEAIDTAADETPLREAFVSDTSLASDDEVLALAQGHLSPGGRGGWQLACTIHTSPDLPLWQVRPGAPVEVKVAGLDPFPTGWVHGRILKATYDLGSDLVAVEIEEGA